MLGNRTTPEILRLDPKKTAKIISEIDPKQYFEHVKSTVQTINSDELKAFYATIMPNYDKALRTGQRQALKKYIFMIDCLRAEEKLIEAGITQYVCKDDLKYFLDKVTRKVVNIAELKQFERDIPDDVVDIVEKVKPLFTNLYIVFTDYTGEHKKTAKIERDPIIFGTIRNVKAGLIHDRFYYLADWEDPYCDLTLEKMVNEMKKETNIDMLHNIEIPKDTVALQQQLAALDENYKYDTSKLKIKRTTWFSKVKTFVKTKIGI